MGKAPKLSENALGVCGSGVDGEGGGGHGDASVGGDGGGCPKGVAVGTGCGGVVQGETGPGVATFLDG